MEFGRLDSNQPTYNRHVAPSRRTSSADSSWPVRVSIAAVISYSRVSVSVRIVMMPIECHFSAVLVVVTWSTMMRPSLIAVSMATASPVLGFTYSPAPRSMMPCDAACAQTYAHQYDDVEIRQNSSC